MAYVFGDTLICSDSESAKAVTFNPQIGMKSVTLEGDVYDPSGMCSRGAAPQSSRLLATVQEMNKAKEMLHSAQAELEKEDEKSQGAKWKWKELKLNIELKEHELGILKEQVNGGNTIRVSHQYKPITFAESFTGWCERRRA